MSQTTAANPLFGTHTKTDQVFQTSLVGANQASFSKTSSFLKKYWNLYPQGTQSLNGNVFEALIAIALKQENNTIIPSSAHSFRAEREVRFSGLLRRIWTYRLIG